MVIVGDLFDLWFGHEHLSFEYQAPIVGRMRELSERGLRMSYVEGNRDYGIGRYRDRIFAEVSDRGLLKNWGAHRVYFEHGDQINTRDRQYLAWRKISKNAAALWLMDHTPSSWLLRWANRMEQGMRQTNLKYKVKYPDVEVDLFCRRTAAAGSSSIIVFGHFHAEKEFTVEAGGRNVLCYNLPGWEAGFRYLTIPEDGKPVFEEIKG